MDNHSPRALRLSLGVWCTAAISDYQCNNCKLDHLQSKSPLHREAKAGLPSCPSLLLCVPEQATFKTCWPWFCLSSIFCLICNQSILNSCICVHIGMQSTFFSPFLTAVCSNSLYPSQGLRFLPFLSRGPGKAAQGEGLLLFKHCIPPSWNDGLRRRQSPACSRRVIAFWKWAAALRASVPSKCSFQSPSAGRTEQGSSAPQLGWGH